MRGIGEQWLPVPERLVRDIETAPTARRRAWAICYLVVWVLVFVRSRRGDTSTLRDLAAWSDTARHGRIMKAKKEALTAISLWDKTGAESEQNWSKTGAEVSASNADNPDRLEQDWSKTGAIARALPSTGTELQSTEREAERSTATVDKPPPFVDKPTPAPLSEKSQEREVQAPSPSGWTSSVVLACWREAWRASERGVPPAPTDRESAHWLPKLVSEMSTEGMEPAALTAILTRWLVAQAAGEGRVFPSRGEVPQLCHISTVWKKHRKQPASAPVEDVELVWFSMLNAMGRVGARRLPTPTDAGLPPETFERAFKALGGARRWAYLCQSKTDSLNFNVRPGFVRAFREVA